MKYLIHTKDYILPTLYVSGLSASGNIQYASKFDTIEDAISHLEYRFEGARRYFIVSTVELAHIMSVMNV
jgi:hypothetical protein